MKKYLMKITIALLLVLTVTNCSSTKTIDIAQKSCIEVSEQKKIDTVIKIPIQKNIPFKRIGNVTIVDKAISDKLAKYIDAAANKKIVVSTDDSFTDMLRSIAKHRASSSALVVVREFYENQIDANNNRLRDSNVSK